jgi:hypothetical protein
MPLLEPGSALVVLTSGGEPAAKLEVVAIENAIASGGSTTVDGLERQDQLNHDTGGLPLTGRDTGIEMGGARFEERLPYVGAHAPAGLYSCSGGLAHEVGPLWFR